MNRTRLILALVLTVLAGCAHTPTRETDQQAVGRLAAGYVRTLSPENVSIFLKAKRDDWDSFQWFPAAAGLRQLYFTGAQSEGRKAFCSHIDYCDIDHWSMVILVRAWEKIHEQDPVFNQADR
jgi:hypothetical protein